MEEKVRRLELLYREVMRLSQAEFKIFECMVGNMDMPILHNFCKQVKWERKKEKKTG